MGRVVKMMVSFFLRKKDTYYLDSREFASQILANLERNRSAKASLFLSRYEILRSKISYGVSFSLIVLDPIKFASQILWIEYNYCVYKKMPAAFSYKRKMAPPFFSV